MAWSAVHEGGGARRLRGAANPPVQSPGPRRTPGQAFQAANYGGIAKGTGGGGGGTRAANSGLEIPKAAAYILERSGQVF